MGSGGKSPGGLGAENVANAAAANRLTTFLPMTLSERDKTLHLTLPLAFPFGGRSLHPPGLAWPGLERMDIHQQLILCASATM